MPGLPWYAAVRTGDSCVIDAAWRRPKRIDLVGDHSDELYAELEGMNLLHFTKLGGITR